MSSIQALLLSALVVCTSCKHQSQRPAAPSGGEAPGSTGSSELQAGAAAEPNQVCTGDAGTCAEAECAVAADCKPAECRQAVCMNAECSYAPLPTGSACGTNKVCSQTGTCGECVPGTQRCVPGSATLLETCSESGTWQRTTCEGQACFNAQCTGECEPGSTTCEAERQRTCGVDGRYATAMPCATGSCNNGNCTPECQPGESKCLDQYRTQACNENGTWTAITTCTDRCDLTTGQCQASCTPGLNRCADDKISQCESNAQWGAAISCPNGCTAKGCNECSPDTAECPSPQDRMLIRICNPDGTWRPTEGCRANSQCIGGKGNTCPCNPGYHPNGRPGNPEAGDCIPN